MKKTTNLKTLTATAYLLLTTFFSFAQDAAKDFTEINFYRIKQSMMSGGAGLEIKVSLNDKEIGSVLNGTIVKYKLYSEGSLKIKGIATGGGGVVGQPAVITIEVKHGQVYNYSASGGMGGAKLELLDEKQLAKMQKEKFADTVNVEEDKASPVIKQP
ncbi:MAG: hypothetical protein ABI855_04285 [Bacteroidota bacterium]